MDVAVLQLTELMCNGGVIFLYSCGVGVFAQAGMQNACMYIIGERDRWRAAAAPPPSFVCLLVLFRLNSSVAHRLAGLVLMLK